MSDQDSEWLAALRDAGRALPDGAPTRARAEAVRTSLLLLAETDAPVAAATRRRAPMTWLAVAAAAGLLVWLGLPDPDSPSESASTTTPLASSLAPAGADDSGRRASIEASHAADFEHTARALPESLAAGRPVRDEVVRLRTGRLAIAVARLRPRERFRVIAGNAALESRSASFDVEVVADRFTEIAVRSGQVALRLRHRPELLLTAGERWRATGYQGEETSPAAASTPAVASTPSAASKARARLEKHAATALASRGRTATRPTRSPQHDPRPASTPAPRKRDLTTDHTDSAARSPQPPPGRPTPEKIAPPPRIERPALTAPTPEPRADSPPTAPTPGIQPTATERAFENGWQHLRASHYGRAATAFAQAIDAAPAAPLAQDARYWRAVALARAGRSRAAAAAMKHFLDHHPGSTRAGEISVMLGWLRLQAGDVSAAKALFQAGLSASAPNVREAARKGLSAAQRVADR